MYFSFFTSIGCNTTAKSLHPKLITKGSGNIAATLVNLKN